MEDMEKLEDVHICIQPQPQPQPHISETREKGEKGEKIQNGKLDLNMLDAVNYITLETMSNNDSYTKYLKRNKLDHDAVLKKEKKFYRKRIIALTKDILFNNVNANTNTNTNTNANAKTDAVVSGDSTTTTTTLIVQRDIPKVDDVIISAFNTFARLCISHFKFKDTMDTIQYEYKDMNKEACPCGDVQDDDGSGDEDMSNNINEANKLCMKQTDKKILTLDNYVVKTSAPKKEMILPKTKNVNLKDPKFKKKDIKVSMSTFTAITTTN
jgi:hypothetical protein